MYVPAGVVGGHCGGRFRDVERPELVRSRASAGVSTGPLDSLMWIPRVRCHAPWDSLPRDQPCPRGCNGRSVLLDEKTRGSQKPVVSFPPNLSIFRA